MDPRVGQYDSGWFTCEGLNKSEAHPEGVKCGRRSAVAVIDGSGKTLAGCHSEAARQMEAHPEPRDRPMLSRLFPVGGEPRVLMGEGRHHVDLDRALADRDGDAGRRIGLMKVVD